LIDLTGKNAIVCGSTQGIGRACAEILARQGATVTLAARNESSLKATVAQLPTPAGQEHKIICANFTDPTSVREKAAQHVDRFGPVEILVNNTGGPPAGPIFDADADAFTNAFTMHVLCNQALAQTLVPGMKERAYGRIINVISISVKQPIPGLGVSNTIRGAVAGWSKTLASELGPFGITVNNVLPGFTDTARLRSLIESKAKRAGVSIDEMTRSMMAEVPAGRLAGAEEIAAAVAFLASPEAAYINGINVPVDGGRTSSL
jgi:3-oxoacyl-[acyl-carrier protein] reductase